MCHACSFPTTLGAWHPDPLIRPLSISWMLRSSITSSSSGLPLCTSITPSLFHSRLKTYLFHKSYPLPRSFTSGMPPRTFACTVSSELLAFWFYFLPLFFPFWAVRLIKLAIPSAFERTLIYRIVSYRKYTLRPIATDVIRNMRSVCLCVCVSVCLCVVELCKKNGSGWLNSSKEPCIKRRSRSDEKMRGDKSAMRPFAKLLWTFVIINLVCDIAIFVLKKDVKLQLTNCYN